MIKKITNRLSAHKTISLILIAGILLVSVFYVSARQTFAENEPDIVNASSTELFQFDDTLATSTEATSTIDIIPDTDQMISTTTTTATTTEDTFSTSTEMVSDTTSTTPVIVIDPVINATTTDVLATSTEEIIATTTEEVSTTLKSISIRTLPNKRTFVVGDLLDVAELVVDGTFSDGSTRAVPISPAFDMANVIGFDSSVPMNNQTITIKYEGVSTSYTVDIF